jgi:molybdate transport system substrate-binding protein
MRGVLTGLFLLLACTNVQAEEVRVLAAAELQRALSAIIPEFERESGHKVTVDFASQTALAPKLTSENVDVVLASTLVEDAAKEQKVVPGTKTDFARTMLGVVIRSGASKPDFSSVISAVRSLLAAKSIAIADPGTQADGRHLLAVAARLEANGALTLKMIPLKGADLDVVSAVVRGEAELGIARINEILATPEAALAGRLPEEFQAPVVYSGWLHIGANQAASGKQLIDYLKSPAAQKVLTNFGMDTSDNA